MNNSDGRQKILSFLQALHYIRQSVRKRRYVTKMLSKNQDTLSRRKAALLELGSLSSTDLQQIASHRLTLQSSPDSQPLSCPSLKSLKEAPSSRWSTGRVGRAKVWFSR